MASRSEMGHKFNWLLGIVLFVWMATPAAAQYIYPVSYQMNNGDSGSYHYWDYTYSGNGNKHHDGARLTGGTGQLTDDRVGGDHWYSDLGNGKAYEWLGWSRRNPVITFDFGQPKEFSSIAIHANNNGRGGVELFSEAELTFSNDGRRFGDRIVYRPSAADRRNRSARFHGIAADRTARYVRVRFKRNRGHWVFVSEIRFVGNGGGAVSASAAPVPYAQDFEGSIGEEWSNRHTISQTSAFTRFSGRFENQQAQTLTVATTPGVEHTILFDLYIIDWWDGKWSWQNRGPDTFSVKVNGTAVFSHAFSNWAWSLTDYSRSADWMYQNFGFGRDTDSIYKRVYIHFTPTSATTTISFRGSINPQPRRGSWGIDNVHVVERSEADALLPVYENVWYAKRWYAYTTWDQNKGAGLNWVDVDADGDLDAIVTGHYPRLMRNTGGTFYPGWLAMRVIKRSWTWRGKTRTYSYRYPVPVWRQGALLDADGDGDVDFWTVGFGGSFDSEAVLLNNGRGVFAVDADMGITIPSNNEASSVADVNNDGRPDVVMFSGNGNWVCFNKSTDDEVAFEASDESSIGLTAPGAWGNGDFCSSADVNNDGYLDFFYHYGGGKLFLSNGDGTYIQQYRGIHVPTGKSVKIGSAWGDFDNDGDMDLFVPSYAENDPGSLWLNNDAWFTNVTRSAGITTKFKQRSCTWGDYDNDGDLDLYVIGDGRGALYQNQGDMTFRAVETGVSGAWRWAQDAVFVDYDNDGDLDLSTSERSWYGRLYENKTNNDAYLKVRVVGAGQRGTDVAGAGVRIDLYDATGEIFLGRREVGTARGYGGTEPLWAHFGGVDPTSEYVVKAYFNSGVQTAVVVPGEVSTTIGSATIDQMVTLTEPPQNAVRVVHWREIGPDE